MEQTLLLYELADARGRVFSPYCWRTRLALQLQRLPFASRPVSFLEIAEVEDGRFKTVPVLRDGDCVTGDSWEIALYLDHRPGAAHPLFASDGARRHACFIHDWFGWTITPQIFPIIALDIHARQDLENQAYFRRTREQRLGRPLEQFCTDRPAALQRLRKSLEPLRQQLTRAEWLAGDEIGYADFIPYAGFVWAELMSEVRLLDETDPLHDWLSRCHAWREAQQPG